MIDVSLQSGALTERTGTRMFFHGGKNAVRAIDPDTFGPDGELLCGSASPNVALRYGPIVTRLTVARWTSMTLQEFWANTTSFETLRARGIGAVVVTGDPQMFDFPVDTVFILDSASTRCEPNGCDVDSLAQQLDGLPQREPAGPSEPGWDLYLASVYGGDLDDLLTNLGWEVGAHHWKLSIVAIGNMRPFVGLVTKESKGGYLAEHNCCSHVTAYATLADALVAVDFARRSYLADPTIAGDRRTGRDGIGAYDAVHEDPDTDYPL